MSPFPVLLGAYRYGLRLRQIGTVCRLRIRLAQLGASSLSLSFNSSVSHLPLAPSLCSSSSTCSPAPTCLYLPRSPLITPCIMHRSPVYPPPARLLLEKKTLTSGCVRCLAGNRRAASRSRKRPHRPRRPTTENQRRKENTRRNEKRRRGKGDV